MPLFPDHFFVSSLISIGLVVMCVVLHYEFLHRMSRWLNHTHNRRVLLAFIMCGLLVAHVCEIWIFAGGYYLTQQWLAIGEISPITYWFDYVYYSAMVYTTVGFGDITPSAGSRMISSAEALTGLALITWSASFTFLFMSKLWGNAGGNPNGENQGES